MKNLFAAFFLLWMFTCIGCKQYQNTNEEELVLYGKSEQNEDSIAVATHSKGHDDVLKLEEAYAKLIGNDSIKVIVEGQINDMCQKDGCWIAIKFDDKNELFVFLDKHYPDFAVDRPKNKSVIIEGYLYSKELNEYNISALEEHIGMDGKYVEATKKVLTLRANNFKEKS